MLELESEIVNDPTRPRPTYVNDKAEMAITLPDTSSGQEAMHIVTDCEPIDESKSSSSPRPSKEECVGASVISVRNEMLDYLSCSVTAFFKSQQLNEPELNVEQKRKIAEDVLLQSPSKFLTQFGRQLEEKHLKYFASTVTDDYEVTFHLQQLYRFHCKAKKQVDVKNRRFQALKKLLSEGSYFSESEMKNRNPLLYEQLIGRYLTQHEIEERQHADMVANSTLVNVLLAQIERDERVKLCKQQLEDEYCALEEEDTSDEDSEQEDDQQRSDNESETEREEGSSMPVKRKLPSHAEKELFKEEFYSYMYNNFLEGQDKEFDYSVVDFNPEFECLEFRTQDEEEKYFDSEPEMVIGGSDAAIEEIHSDDELDIFMKNLKPEPTPIELAGEIEKM